MATDTPIATSHFYVDRGTGTRSPASVQIFSPRRHKRSVVCRVRMNGILVKPIRVYSEDSMQAIALSVRFVNNTLVVHPRERWRFFLERNDRRPIAFWKIWGAPAPHGGRSRCRSARGGFDA